MMVKIPAALLTVASANRLARSAFESPNINTMNFYGPVNGDIHGFLVQPCAEPDTPEVGPNGKCTPDSRCWPTEE